MKHQ
jgi:hypothetical protein